MSAISDRFKSHHKALIPYVTVGHPSAEATKVVVVNFEGQSDQHTGTVAGAMAARP